LNALGVRPPENRVVITGDTTKDLQVKVEPSFADNVLVVGPRYQSEDIKCIWTTHLGMRVSGVCGMATLLSDVLINFVNYLILFFQVMGVNKGTKMVRNLQTNYPLRTYHLHGKLGIMTKNMYIDGQVIEKGRYDFVKRENVDKLMSTIQASNQKKMFE